MKPIETQSATLIRERARIAVEPARAEVASAPAAAFHIARRERVGYWSVAGSHLIVDLYPTFILALAVALQHRLRLTGEQVAWLFALNPIFSGLSQPLLAWLSDRFNSRIIAPIGLAVGAVCLSAVGFANSFGQLIALQMVGMAGTGVYHPIAAGLAGETGRRVFEGRFERRSPRGFALSLFFAMGMVGGFLGPIAATRINQHFGIMLLLVMAVPGLVAAAALWAGTTGISHRSEAAHPAPLRADGSAASNHRARWFAVGLLFCSNSLLFITNIGLYYLYKQWAEANIAGAPEVVSSRAGDLIAASQLGMAVGGLALGFLIRPGRERGALLLAVCLTAPVIIAMPNLGFGGLLAASFVASIGYFSAIPAFLALAQRLLPHATGLVGSMLMGCGWAVASCSPFLGQWMIGRWGLSWAFAGFAIFMVAAGLVSLLVPGRLIREAAHAA